MNPYHFMIGLVMSLIIVGMALSAYLNEPVEVIKHVETVEEVMPEWATDEEAVEAAQAVLQRKALEKRIEDLNAQVEGLEADFEASKRVFWDERAGLEQEIELLQKQHGMYWRDKGNLKALIRQTFPERPTTALAIAQCESGLQTDIQSRHILSYGREESFGLFQIHARVWHETALSLGLVNYKTDPEQNAKMARYIYEQAGNSFQPWTCYSQKMIAMR